MESPARCTPDNDPAPDPLSPPPRLSTPVRHRRRPGLVATGLLTALLLVVVAGGALLAGVSWRSEATGGDYLRSGSTPVGSVSVASLGVSAARRAPAPIPGVVAPVSATADAIDVAFDLTGVTEPMPISARLVDEKTQSPCDLAPVLVDRDRHLVFTFTRGSHAWATGRWRATVSVNGFEAAFTEFDVR